MSIRLLVADDHETVRDGLRFALSQTEIEIAAEATTAAAALEMALTNAFDLLLLDIRFPDGNGFHVLEALKSQRATSRVLMYSIHDFSAHRARAAALKADGFVSKGVDFRSLVEAIRAAARPSGGPCDAFGHC